MERYIRKPNIECQECRKKIYRRPSQISSGPVFCSLLCSSKRFKKQKKQCPICKNLFEITKDRFKTCSRRCSNKARSGLVYHTGNSKNNAIKVRKLKISLVALRGPNCEVCNLSEIEILVVHHIKERAKGGNDNIRNLKLLCPNCHARIHYGKMGEWLKPLILKISDP